MSKNNRNFPENDISDCPANINAITSTTVRDGDVTMLTNKMNNQNKRPFKGNKYGEPPAKRPTPTIQLDAGFKWNLQALANAADAVESGGKSPVSALNELGVKVMYKVVRQGGPAHCPSFNVAVTVADMTFEGCGHSKRDARASAARACLAALLARAGRVLPAPSQNQDFTSDEGLKYPVSDFQCLEAKVKPPVVLPKPDIVTSRVPSPPSPNQQSPSTALFGASVVPSTNKSPINTLYENYPGLTFICTFGDGSPLESAQVPLQLSHSMRFKVVCYIKDQKYEGYGSSKKLAKLAAARSALAVLEEGMVEAPPTDNDLDYLPQTLADHVGKLVNEKFNEIMKNDIVHSKRKVLAGIVITINNKIENARVIAVTTGTKCVSGEHMSVRGRAVNDCHAEVAARRCLQRHLYAQLLEYAAKKDPTETIPESDLEPVPRAGGYQLKPCRQLHLYVSTAPCGDGRIFSPHENNQLEPDRHPNRLARGQLRTKIESGEGTIPVKNCNNVVQTWDGVLQGERLLTMSCSDKVARWCVVGMQGALLSRLLRPVYLTSLVLGSLLHQDHMYRAICGRIEKYIAFLPPPFRLQRPLLARAASTEARTPARAPSFSVCWCCTTPMPEIINATTGKLENGQPSLLCKQSMFARWQYLVKRLPQLQQESIDVETVQIPENIDNLPYNEAKLMCTTYQVAKNNLALAFQNAKLGSWIKKPLEQDHFLCELIDADVGALFAWAGSSLPVYSTVQDKRYDGGVFGDLIHKFKLGHKTDVGRLTIGSELDRIDTKGYRKDPEGVRIDVEEHIHDLDRKINVGGHKIDVESHRIDSDGHRINVDHKICLKGHNDHVRGYSNDFYHKIYSEGHKFDKEVKDRLVTSSTKGEIRNSFNVNEQKIVRDNIYDDNVAAESISNVANGKNSLLLNHLRNLKLNTDTVTSKDVDKGKVHTQFVCDRKEITLRSVGSDIIKTVQLNESFRYVKNINNNAASLNIDLNEYDNDTTDVKVKSEKVPCNRQLLNRFRKLKLKVDRHDDSVTNIVVANDNANKIKDYAIKYNESNDDTTKLVFKSSLLARKLEIHKKIIGKQ